ncbi:hypothetical protein ACHQM5_002927 [Ranunculus cassubicifolius]
MSSVWTKICFNQVCRTSQSVQYRKGWMLRNGNYAELCDRCSAAYERGKFCDIFHVDAAGWRSCESCGKRIHCGCIVSVSEIILLDAGGVYCVACARKNIFMCRAPNQIWQSSSTFSPPSPCRPKDMSAKNWNQTAGPSAASGHWRQPFSNWNSSGASVLNPTMHYDVDGSRQISGESSASVLEKRRLEPSYGHILAVMNNFRNVNAVKNMVNGSYMLPKDDVSQNVLQGLGPLTGEYGVNTRKSELAESCHPSYSGMRYEAHPNACADALQQSSLKEDPSDSHSAAVPYSFPKTDCLDSYSVIQPKQPDLSTPAAKKFNDDELQHGMDSGETHKHTESIPTDARRRCQDVQHLSEDPNSVITPLFEKVLSASDAGKMGRIVLPKRYAEAHFPKLTQSEGVPLKFQDANGNEWVLQFRFWPNNNSRIYVLEGVAAPFHSMQLLAGDTIRFGRITPGGKLVMGFRKAARSLPSDQINEGDPSGSTAKDQAWSKPAISPTKRKNSILASKSKRLRIDNEDLIELDLTWDEAQGLFRPPPNLDPSIVVIDGQAFEEYEEAPVFGKPRIYFSEKIQWAQCEDCSKWRKLPASALVPSRWTCSHNSWDATRSSCLSDQEITLKEIQDIVSFKDETPKKIKRAQKKMGPAQVSQEPNDDGLSPISRGRHPRHQIGCACIICVQSPKGKGHKYKDTCDCIECQTRKRRIITLMNRHSVRETVSSKNKSEQFKLPKDEIPRQKIVAYDDSSDENSCDKKKIPASTPNDQLDLMNKGNVFSDEMKNPASPPKDQIDLINKGSISSDEKKNPASPPNDQVDRANKCNVSSGDEKKNPALPPNDQIDLTKDNVPSLQAASISFSSCMVRLLSGNHKLQPKPTNGILHVDSSDPTEDGGDAPDPAKVSKTSVMPSTTVRKLTTYVDDTEKQ